MADDVIIDKAWSDVQPPDFIRWATPRFIKYGRVLTHKDRSLLCQFIDDAQPRAIPDAKWYYSQAKAHGPHAEEHIVVIDYAAWYNGPAPEPFIPPADDAHEQFISAAQAAEFLNMDEKQVRRYIRRGKIRAFKKDDRWVIHREALREAAAKAGWI